MIRPGGGLTLALAMALRDRGIALPAALGLICPWADLAIDIDQMRPVLRDPLILPSMCAEWAPHYAGSLRSEVARHLSGVRQI